MLTPAQIADQLEALARRVRDMAGEAAPKRRGVKITRSEPEPADGLPLHLATEAFRRSWDGFRDMRDATGKPMTTHAIHLAWQTLASLTMDEACRALDICTQRNWQGVDWGIREVTAAPRAAWGVANEGVSEAESERARARKVLGRAKP